MAGGTSRWLKPGATAAPPPELTFQRKSSARVILPGSRAHHPRYSSRQGRHCTIKKNRKAKGFWDCRCPPSVKISSSRELKKAICGDPAVWQRGVLTINKTNCRNIHYSVCIYPQYGSAVPVDEWVCFTAVEEHWDGLRDRSGPGGLRRTGARGWG